MIKNEVLIIINHNDATSSDELKNISLKVDNDKNTIHISEVISKYGGKVGIQIKRVIFLTNTAGLLDRSNKTICGGKVEYEDMEEYLSYIDSTKSDSGTGGMGSKIECAFECLKYEVEESIISNAKTGLDCIKNRDICTTYYL